MATSGNNFSAEARTSRRTKPVLAVAGTFNSNGDLKVPNSDVKLRYVVFKKTFLWMYSCKSASSWNYFFLLKVLSLFNETPVNNSYLNIWSTAGIQQEELAVAQLSVHSLRSAPCSCGEKSLQIVDQISTAYGKETTTTTTTTTTTRTTCFHRLSASPISDASCMPCRARWKSFAFRHLKASWNAPPASPPVSCAWMSQPQEKPHLQVYIA